MQATIASLISSIRSRVSQFIYVNWMIFLLWQIQNNTSLRFWFLPIAVDMIIDLASWSFTYSKRIVCIANFAECKGLKTLFPLNIFFINLHLICVVACLPACVVTRAQSIHFLLTLWNFTAIIIHWFQLLWIYGIESHWK